ncbi:hypothetical protein [Hyalangium rubrum]|uniref:Lipoprotein LpqB beta-propeller domain-containing protein n=1 Tax=Hyalangium rubrum TaxID=3103134 RepID=A0ABU5H978_9BACT|nr:hypothetical protein [Hyalangium sp. s54d21]MDY7230030.1 hypothetical protein [Hyalangium sp. s54d21]
MSSLPPALHPWATQLAIFPEELALSLGPYVARLSAAIGALRPRGEADGGEPQGYDGLTRRGSYERLLLTEWLYALESPDEFVRRAAFGEQAFLKPAFKQPQGSRRTVVLMDAGPDQLGAPRIAHLALLVVLQRRAEAAGAEFVWGVLQSSPDKGPFTAVTPATVNTWLSARSGVPVRGEHVARWREALALGSAPEDGWLVGDARLARFPEAAGLSRVDVAEVVAPGVRKLSVAVRRLARAPAAVELELPPADACVRLLRDPFTVRATAPVRLSRSARVQSFFFSADGSRLILARADGSMAVQPLPHSPRATVPRPRRFQPAAGQVLVAAGWRRNGGLLALTRDDRTLWIHGWMPEGSRITRPRGIPYLGYEGLLPDAPAPHLPPGLATVQVVDDRERVLVRDAEGRLFLVNPQGPALLASRVSAFAEVKGRPSFVMTPAEGSPMEGVWLGLLEDFHQRHVPLGPGDGKAYFGHVHGFGHPEAGLLALRHQPGTWQVLMAQGNVQLSVPVGSRVVGVGINSYPKKEPGLLLLGPDRRGFMLLSPSGVRTVTRAAQDVVHAEASHGQPLLAWLTVKGELVVWSFQHETAIYRAAPEEGS